MFGIGFPELVVIFVVALIVLGPKQLPETARTLGRWFYQIKETADRVRRDMEAEFGSTTTMPPPAEEQKNDAA